MEQFVAKIPTAGVVVLDGDQVLLVRHGEAAEHLTNVYGLPSGRFQDGETAEQAAVRELNEETGLSVHEGDLQRLPEEYSAQIPRKDGTVKYFSLVVFLYEYHDGEVRTSTETIPEWIEIAQLKQYSLLPNVENAIAQARRIRHESTELSFEQKPR